MVSNPGGYFSSIIYTRANSHQPKSISLSLKIQLFLILLVCERGLLMATAAPEETEELQKLNFLNIKVDRNIYVNDNLKTPRVLVVRDLAKRVRITCQASCPVQWTLDKYRYGSFPPELKGSYRFQTRREFADFWNVSSYKYTATMILEGVLTKVTGNYSCTCADKRQSHESIYICWEGSSASYLLQAGENWKITQNGTNPWVRIYCGASKPDVPVFLFSGTKPLLPNNVSIIQDIDGFMVDISSLPLRADTEHFTFICSLRKTVTLRNKDDFSEIARYEVTKEIIRKETVRLNHFDTLVGDSKGLVHYDTESNSLICCSKDANHRQVGFYCENPQMCMFLMNRLSWGGGNAPGLNSTCTWYTEGFWAQDGAVVFRCDNRNDFEAEAEKFYGINSKSYFNINEAETEMWNVIDLSFNATRAHRFLRASIRYRCQHSSYLFSEGLIWMLLYQNGSQVILNLESITTKNFNVDNIWMEDNNKDWIELRINNRDIVQLACLLPLWNSNAWWNSTLDLSLKESIPPTFDHPDNEEIEISSKESATLQCIASGYPMPNITWQKDGKIITETMANKTEEIEKVNLDTNRTTNSVQPIRVKSVVSIKIQENTTGNYICKAQSDVGESSKTFVVNKKDSTISKVVGITAGVIVVLLLILAFSLRKIAEQRKAIRFLSKKEIDEFEKGNPEALARMSSNDYTNDAHHLLPYNTDYEVPKQMLFIDYGVILGQGTYGMVLKGRLKKGGEDITVAVKTIKPNEDASHFKILLCELKIMAYIGSHPNILSLVGAHTRNIRNRELFVATEFCENGNLLDLLRNSRGQFRDNHNHNQNYQNSIPVESPGYANSAYQISTKELLQWAADIATGMEYLGTKRVIHGDLACRNILLGRNRIAKVGDFGLSKHIFQYSTYQKKTVQLLPWRAMALESLTDMIFSLQSDVWAYGVTLWEVFTLGQTPYPGMVWDENFILKLQNDYRLPKPQFATQEIYELILSCWVPDPSKRPNVGVLKTSFEHILESFGNKDRKLF